MLLVRVFCAERHEQRVIERQRVRVPEGHVAFRSPAISLIERVAHGAQPDVVCTHARLAIPAGRPDVHHDEADADAVAGFLVQDAGASVSAAVDKGVLRTRDVSLRGVDEHADADVGRDDAVNHAF